MNSKKKKFDDLEAGDVFTEDYKTFYLVTSDDVTDGEDGELLVTNLSKYFTMPLYEYVPLKEEVALAKKL